MKILTATYQGHDVEILDIDPHHSLFGRNCKMAQVRTLDGTRPFGFWGMWGGCERDTDWVPVTALTNVRVEEIPADLPIADDPRVDEPEYPYTCDGFGGSIITGCNPDDRDAEQTRRFLQSEYYGGM